MVEQANVEMLENEQFLQRSFEDIKINEEEINEKLLIEGTEYQLIKTKDHIYGLVRQQKDPNLLFKFPDHKP